MGTSSRTEKAGMRRIVRGFRKLRLLGRRENLGAPRLRCRGLGTRRLLFGKLLIESLRNGLLNCVFGPKLATGRKLLELRADVISEELRV